MNIRDLKMKLRNSSEFKFFLLCLALNIILFILFYLVYQGRNWTIYNDSGDYVGIAESVISNHSFAFERANPDGSRTPLYPLFLTIFNVNVGVAVFAQHVLSALVSVLLFRLGKDLFSVGAGRLAGIFFALEPSVVVWTDQALTEPLFTFLLVGFLSLFILGLRRHHLLPWSGAVIGLMVLTRPVALLLIIPIVLFLLVWKYFNFLSFKKIILFICLFLVTIFPWYLRNRITFGVWTLETMSKVVLNYEATLTLNQHEDEAVGRRLKEKYPDRQGEEITTADYTGRFNRHPASNAYYKERAAAIIKTYPWTFLSLHLSGAKGVLFSHNYDYYADIFTRSIGLDSSLVNFLASVSGPAVWYSTPLLAVVGFIFSLRKTSVDAKLKLILLFGVIVYFVLITGRGGNDRFRYPIAPLLFLFAFYGLFSIWGLLKNKYHRGSATELQK